jgi:hypothetical protein
MIIPKLKKGGMYYVEWNDTLIRSDWTEDDTDDFLKDSPTVRFMGWYAKRDKESLVFVMHCDMPPGKVVGERIKVPKGMISNIKKLSFAE